MLRNSILFFVLASFTLHAQEDIRRSTTALAYSNFKFQFDKAEGNRPIDLFTYECRTLFRKNTYFNFDAETELKQQKSYSSIKRVTVQYQSPAAFRSKRFLKNGIAADIECGLTQWEPSYSNTTAIFENIETYFDQNTFFGCQYRFNLPLLPQQRMQFIIGGYTLKLKQLRFANQLKNIYLQYHQALLKHFFVAIRAGKTENYTKLINEAVVGGELKSEELVFSFKAGKLQAYEAFPYGIHLALKRKFKYFAVSAYLEKRAEQPEDLRIMGFGIQYIGDSKVVSFLNKFQVRYYMGTNTLLMQLPILKIKANYK